MCFKDHLPKKEMRLETYRMLSRKEHSEFRFWAEFLKWILKLFTSKGNELDGSWPEPLWDMLKSEALQLNTWECPIKGKGIRLQCRQERQDAEQPRALQVVSALQMGTSLLPAVLVHHQAVPTPNS